MADMENKVMETEENLSELLQVRRDKLSELQSEGRDPFQITKYNRTHTSGDIKNNYTEEEREETDRILKEFTTELCAEYNITIDCFHINPTGKFLIGGFDGDAGLTGRKIVVDAYQSFANVGGGAFSGKDPTKVDRSAAYKARQLAKECLMSRNDFKWCEVQLSYAIGLESPLAIYVRTDKGDYEGNLNWLYPECTPKRIIEDLHLLDTKKVKYYSTAKFGHFGHSAFPWE